MILIFINPTLYERGWIESLIREEKTPGSTDIIEGRPRKRRGRTDYLLCIPIAAEGKPPLPVAILEAKAEDKLPSLGIQQAKDYMKKFNVPFIFSTNGKLYAEYGKDIGQIKDALSLSGFPTPDELKQRHEEINGLKLDSGAAKPLLMPYKGGEAARYHFQDAAVRAALEKIAHRSAWGKWSVILTENPNAIHIGLTATPRIVVGGKKGSDGRKGDEAITAHNIRYFGEPVYEYSIGDGQEDGYLAACEVIRKKRTDIY